MNRSVLIVDDDKLTCWGLEKIMSTHNLLITSVNNGRDAISEVVSRPFNSVFLDINLPDINGFDVLKEIRKLSPATKVIVISADDTVSNRQRAMDEGSFHFMGKPFSVPEIKKVINSCMSDSQTDQCREQTI
ncbi:MAG: response regulator [Candidatus Sulfobium sp.]|jgi:DNA-binding NtrC family response regulator